MKVRTNMFKKDVFLEINKKKKCDNCNTFLKDREGDVAMMTEKGKPNKIICYKCAAVFIEKGAEDISAKIASAREEKEQLIKMIKDTGLYRKGYFEKDLKELNKEELEKKYIYYKELKEKEDRINLIEISPEDAKIEDYLINDYGVIQDTKYLKCEEQIKDYFKEDYHDYFDCGQGYCQDEAHLIIKIAKKYYNVKLYAEIYSSKQDVGDRLYWVENLERIEYKEIEKPLPKDRKDVSIMVMNISGDEERSLMAFLSDYNYNII